MMLASSSVEIKFHDWEAATCLGIYKASADKTKQGSIFHEISWTCDGMYLAAVQMSGKAILLKPTKPNVRSDPFVPDQDIINIPSVQSADFSKMRNNLVAVGTSAGHLLHYNLVNGNSTLVVHDFPGSANIVNYAAGDAFIAVACANGQIFIVQAGKGITETYFIPGGDCISTLSTHPSNPKYIAGGSDKGVIAVWDANTSALLMKASPTSSSVSGLEFSPNDETYLTICTGQKIAIYDLRTKDHVLEKQLDLQLTTIAYATSGNDIAVGTDQGHILCIDRRYLRTCRCGIKAHEQSVRKLKFQHEFNNNFGYMFLSQKSSRCSLFQEPEREGGAIPDVDSELIVAAIGDCNDRGHTSKDTPRNIRVLTGLENAPEKQCNNNFTPSVQQVGGETCMFHIIDERSLNEFKASVVQSTKELIDKVVDQVNTDFLKMRMNVSREFCNMELRNRERWQDMDETLVTLACWDDGQLTEELRMAMIHEEAVRDTSHSRNSKETKMTMDDERSDIEFDDDGIDEEVCYDDNQSGFSDNLLELGDDEGALNYANRDKNESPKKTDVERPTLTHQQIFNIFHPKQSSDTVQEKYSDHDMAKRYNSKLPV